MVRRRSPRWSAAALQMAVGDRRRQLLRGRELAQRGIGPRPSGLHEQLGTVMNASRCRDSWRSRALPTGCRPRFTMGQVAELTFTRRRRAALEKGPFVVISGRHREPYFPTGQPRPAQRADGIGCAVVLMGQGEWTGVTTPEPRTHPTGQDKDQITHVGAMERRG